MIKTIFKFLFYFLVIIGIGIIYLSYFGVETKRFNQLIENQITKKNQEINLKLKSVKFVLNLNNLTVGLKSENPIIVFEDKKINLKRIKTNFSIISFLKKEFSVINLFIETNENKLKDIISLIRIYQNTPQIFILNKFVNDGSLKARINLNFDGKGKINNDYNIKGIVKNAKIKLLNQKQINNVSFNFVIEDKKYSLKNTALNFKKIKLFSKLTTIEKQDKHYLFKGDLKSSENSINSEIVEIFFKENFKDLNIKNFVLSSENIFSFKINKKLKFLDINIESKINLVKFKYENDYIVLKKFFPNYKNFIELKNHKIKLSYNKNKLLIDGQGKFSIDNNEDNIEYIIKQHNGDLNFKSKIVFFKNPILINFLNYEKKKDQNSSLEFEGIYKKNKTLTFENILFDQAKNNFLINNFSLNEKLKINYIDKIDLNFFNTKNRPNKISLKKNKKNYEIFGEVFDGNFIINEVLKNKTKGSFLDNINDLNSNIKINIDKTFVENDYYLNNLNGNIKFKKNFINNLNLVAYFNDNKKFTLSIKKNKNNEKITTIYSEYAKPLVKKYKFIKGFEEGILDFYSVKKNSISNSHIKIYDFKLKELPVLTKILTLASLQGIADLLTGEGIRFNEFEMNFKNEKNLMTIDEIYAIGPAISILTEGYVEKDRLISLRGTLVPATTINKAIGSIPLLGEILVGKKVGEGVFGVSFKIKGPPKNLKTIVNPIKTLTPRFITRTLEKIKKNN